MFTGLDFATLMTNAATVVTDFNGLVIVIGSIYAASRLLRLVKGFLR